ncbi:hypothetical protein Plhal304r1_c033g0105851 [Plasmopara halstedii]
MTFTQYVAHDTKSTVYKSILRLDQDSNPRCQSFAIKIKLCTEISYPVARRSDIVSRWIQCLSRLCTASTSAHQTWSNDAHDYIRPLTALQRR